MPLWRWALWYSSDSVGSEIVKGKKLEFCSVLKRKDKSPDNICGLQWSLFYVCVTQMVDWRKSEGARCNKVIVGKHRAVETHLCTGRRERSAQRRTVPSAVFFSIRWASHCFSQKEMHLQNAFFCLPASIQIKWKVEITYVGLYHACVNTLETFQLVSGIKL